MVKIKPIIVRTYFFIEFQYYQTISPLKGQIASPKQMNFRKSSWGGAHFQSKKIISQILDLLTGLFEHEIENKYNMIFF